VQRKQNISGHKKKQQSKASNEIQLKMAKSCVPVFWLFLVFLGHLEVSFGDKCSKEEKSRLQEEHKVCTNTVQQRYSILTLDTNDLPNPLAISTPMALKTGAGTANSGLEKEYVCKMIEETVQGCARVYAHCFDDREMRLFQDSQLHMILEIMTQVYNMGAVVEECEVIMEFKRSGREGSVLPTDICTMQQVQDVSSDYQECIEAANKKMSTSIVKQKTVETIFDVLCVGMDQIVHECAHILERCYKDEEIIETKLGQLELTKKIFYDILQMEKNSKIFDLNQCSAFSSMNHFMNSSPSQRHCISPLFMLLLFTFLRQML